MPDLQRLSGSEGSACYRKKGRGTQSPWFGGGLGHRILGQSVTAYGKHPGSPPPTNPGSINAHWPCGSARTDREGERVKGCACVCLFVCCTCAWAGKLCGEGKGAAVLMWMSGSLLLQSQLSNLLTAALYKSSQKSYFQQTHKIKEQWYTQKKKQ